MGGELSGRPAMNIRLSRVLHPRLRNSSELFGSFSFWRLKTEVGYGASSGILAYHTIPVVTNPFVVLRWL